MNNSKAVELLALAFAGDEMRLRALLPSPCNLREDDLPGSPASTTALVGAAASGNEAVVELLLQCGADPASRDTLGRSAAAYARAAGHRHLAERLGTVVDIEKIM